MRKLLLLFLLAILAGGSRAQISLPTSWDCDPATLPATGWTTNMSDWYNVGSVGFYNSAPSSCKFSADGRYVKIFFADAPGLLTYYLRGSSFSGGTFDVQESVDGSTWNSLRTFTNANINNNNLVFYTDTLDAASRYVRLYYTDKVSGNVAVDDISITPKLAGPEAEIVIKEGLNVIPSNTQLISGNNDTTLLKVVNLGTDSVLRITSHSFTGTDATMFSLVNLPDSVNPDDSVYFKLVFTPTGLPGTKLATLSLVNNDSDENPYVINIYAVNGSYATEPAAAPVNMTFSGIKSYTFTVNFANATPVPDDYIVLKKSGSPIDEEPADGMTYVVGEFIDSAQVIYIGNAGTFRPTNIVANTNYYFKAFSFNGPSGYENYLTTTTLTNNVSTPHDMIGTYYNAINPAAPTFITDLHNLVNPHTALDYSSYDDYLVDEFESRDTAVAGQTKKVITCPYSGENYVYSEPFSWQVYNREHCYPQSWMPTVNYPDYSTRPEYSDYHNLYPVNATVNGMRTNLPFGEVITVQNSFLNGKLGLDTAGHQVFEPREEHKGDIARTLFYMVICYHGVDGNVWEIPTYLGTFIPYGQDQDVLKAWHAADPPDNFEMARNDYIHAEQGNRNPFIDSIGWVNMIDFYDMPAGVVFRAERNNGVTVYPNPAEDFINIAIEATVSDQVEVCISNLQGGEIIKGHYPVAVGNSVIRMALNVSPGVYLLNVKGNGINSTQKISVK